MARNQITLLLPALGSNIVIPYSNEIVLRSLSGTYRRTGSNVQNVPTVSTSEYKLFEWQLSIPQNANNAALLNELIYLQETGQLGNVVLRDEAQAIPASWLSWGNKTAFGDALTQGTITTRFYQCPVMIQIDPQFEQAIGHASRGNTNWWRSAITAYELPN